MELFRSLAAYGIDASTAVVETLPENPEDGGVEEEDDGDEDEDEESDEDDVKLVFTGGSSRQLDLRYVFSMLFFPYFLLSRQSLSCLADIVRLAFICQIGNRNRLRQLLGLENGHMRVQVRKRLRRLVRLKLVRLPVRLPNVSPLLLLLLEHLY